MANTDKMITETVLKDATEKILQTIADKIYDLVPYDDTEISEILEISDEEAMELTKIISDNVISTNKIWSSNKTNTEIQNAIIEANKYADELIGQISSISLEYVTVLPTSDIKSNVIYILQGTPNTLNVYNTSTSAFVTVGDLDLDLSQYYTKSDVDTLLADKADDNTVVHQDDVVSDMTTTSGTTVLSTSGLKTELDKKANDDEVVKKADMSTTIDSTSTDDTVPTNKTIFNNCVRVKDLIYSYTDALTTLEEVIISILNNTNPQQFKPGVYSGMIASTHSGGGDLGSWKGNYILTVSHNGAYGTSGIINTQSKSFSIQYALNKWIIKRLCATSVVDVPVTTITNNLVSTKVTFQAADSNAYLYVKNGTCYVSIWDVTILEEANLEVLFNNAPKAAFMVGCALHNGYESFGHVFVTTNSTEIRLNAPSGLAGKSGYCSFSYPVAES